jgi:transcriptional regulator of acetoin/glycerol metabolism
MAAVGFPAPAAACAGSVFSVLPLQPPNPSGVIPLVELERRAIVHALESTGGDAVALLGIGRTTLYRKLKEYSVEG